MTRLEDYHRTLPAFPGETKCRQADWFRVHRNQTEQALAAIPCTSYHNFEISRGTGIYTCPSRPRTDAIRTCQTLGLNSSQLRGKRVLDLGAFSGAYTFSFEDEGADVVALDVQDPRTNAFAQIHEIRQSQSIHVMASVYDLHPELFGSFDIVLFFGLFYHLKHPLLAFERVNSVLRPGGTLLGGGTSADAWFHTSDESCAVGMPLANLPVRVHGTGDHPPAPVEFPVAGFSTTQFLRNYSNWFIPNRDCIHGWLAASGFRVEETQIRSAPFPQSWNTTGIPRSTVLFRATCIGNPTPEYVSDEYRACRTDGTSAQEMYEFHIPTAFELERARRRSTPAGPA